MRGQREPPLRMIRRAQAVKFPDCARQDDFGKTVALAPPKIPGAPQKRVRTFLRARQLNRQAGENWKRAFPISTGRRLYFWEPWFPNRRQDSERQRARRLCFLISYPEPGVRGRRRAPRFCERRNPRGEAEPTQFIRVGLKNETVRFVF